MSTEQFKKGLMELYQCEIVGELFSEQLLHRFTEPDQQLKIATILQLETETKARLRPALLALGLPLTTAEASRVEAKGIIEAFKSLNDRDEMIDAMCQQLPLALERYQQITDSAPVQYRELAVSMVAHEQALLDFATMEANGECDKSIAVMASQLYFKLQ